MSSLNVGLGKIADALKRSFVPLTTSKFWLQSLHFLLDLPIGIIGILIFDSVFTSLSRNGGLFTAIIGIPLLAATVLLGRRLAAFGRARAHIFLGDSPPAPKKFHFTGSPLDMTWAALKDAQGWKGLLYAVITVPLGIATFAVITLFWAVALPLSLIFTYYWALPQNRVWIWAFPYSDGFPNLTVNWPGVSGWTAFGVELVLTIVGLFLLGLTPRVTNVLARLDQLLIRSLCSPSPKGLLNQRVKALEESRSASVQSAASELRRIERDLHDGAQQHLVSVAMQLGMVKERLTDETDPETVELITSAHRDAKQAIVELRDLVRGIHPAVLTDRGLDAAVSALAARSLVPVDVQNEVTDRLPQAVEATAYFVIAESLTNIAKHSQATHATVQLSKEINRIVIEVTDDGIGGAHDDTDGGLRGLRDRVRSIEGDMTISSPTNGPTRIIVNLPCE